MVSSDNDGNDADDNNDDDDNDANDDVDFAIVLVRVRIVIDDDEENPVQQ